MDDGHKIDIAKPEVKLFLQEDLLPSRMDTPDLYDLNVEYAKTKSKRLSFVSVVLLCCIAIVALITWGVVMVIETENANIEVDLAVFDDLNLKDLLDVVSKTQDQLDQSIKRKNQLVFELTNQVNLAQLDMDTELQLLDSLRMTNSERLSKEQELQDIFDQKVATLDESIKPQISLLEAQITDLTEQLSSYDSKNIELAKQQEAAINSQKQAFELEKEQLSREYESMISNLVNQIETMKKGQLSTQSSALATLKAQQESELKLLDPTFTDERANELVLAIIGDILVEEAMKAAVEILSEDETEIENIKLVETVSIDEKKVVDKEEICGTKLQGMYLPEVILNLSDKEFQGYVEKAFNELDIQLVNYNYIANIVSSVPWTNSLKEYIIALTEMTNQIGDAIVFASVEFLQAQDAIIVLKNEEIALQEEYIATLENTIAQKNLEQEQVETVLLSYQDVLNSLDERARQNGEAGYILTTDNKNNIDIFISSRHRDLVKDGINAYVFRESGHLIGKIIIKRQGAYFYGVAEESVIDKIRVNDSILLELN